MPDPEEQLRMLRNEEKAERDDQVAEELTQDERLAATLDQHRSEVPNSADTPPPPAP
jgi:hypothetical protein